MRQAPNSKWLTRWFLAAVTSPSGLCFLAKWATFLHPPLSFHRISLKNGGLKKGSGVASWACAEDEALSVAGEFAPGGSRISLWMDGSGDNSPGESRP